MENKIYLIGEFATMNRVSTRMLRHYDKIGLLKPVLINKNEYRYYSEQQIATISKIKMLRECYFTLEEIIKIFENSSKSFLMEQAKYKMIELHNKEQLQKNAMALLKSISEKGIPDSHINQYGVATIDFAEMLILVSNKKIELEYIEKEFDELFCFIDKKQFTVNGCAMILSYISRKGDNNYQVAVPITKPFQNDHYSTIILPAGKRISTIHYGDYHSMGYAYNDIMKYAKESDCIIGDCFMERYFIDSSYMVNKNQYVTEISVPIKDNP